MSAELPTVQAKTFDEDQLNTIIQSVTERFTSNTQQGSLGTSMLLHDRIAWRRQHFYNLPAADPVLPDPWNRAARKYQTDAMRQATVELKARLTENRFVVDSEPIPDIASVRDIAERGKSLMNQGFQDLQRKRQLDIQSAIADGQIIDGLAVLHWRLATEIWPAVPDYEWTDDLPKDPAERKRFKARKVLVDPNGLNDGARRYRETDASLANRRAVQKARAGFPWMVSVPDAMSVYFVRDQSPAENPALVIHVESVGLLDYATKVSQTDNVKVSLNQIDKKIRIYVEEPAPDNNTPSGIVWGDRVSIARVWTRDEYYELVCDDGAETGVSLAGGWQLVKSHTHPYGRPPFALIAGFEFNHPDPAMRYQPALAGMYAIKPHYDQAHAYLDVLAESTAIPMYALVRIKDGMPMLQEDGSPVLLTAEAASAAQIPDGYDLKEFRAEISPGYVSSVLTKKEELHDARPSTGSITQLGANPRPWALRIMLQMANIGPVAMLDNMMTGLETMVENMRMVMGKPVEDGGLGEALSLQIRGKDGAGIKSVDVDEWEQIRLSVRINTVSATERVTLEEHGRELADDPQFPLTLERLGDDYMGWEDTSERIAEWEAEQIYAQYFRPAVQRYVTTKWAGVQFTMGPNGQDIGLNGQPASPEQIAQANGISAMPPTTTRRVLLGAPGGGGSQVNMGAGPGPLQPLQGAPGQVPLVGMPG